jgi:hypothetical protein
MLKCLIFGVTLAFFSLQVAEKAPLLKHDKDNSANHAGDANQHDPISQGTGIVNQVDGSEAAKKGQQKESPSAQAEPDYAALGFWVNLGLTVITLLIAIAALIQANAAKLGAKAVLRSERAWLLLDGELMHPPFLIPIEHQSAPQKRPVHCELALRNCGNTPASAIDWQFELQIGDSAEMPVSAEIYERKPLKESLTPFPIGQDRLGWAFAELSPQKYINAADAEAINAGIKFLWLCGVARYHDVFEQRMWSNWFRRVTETHQTRVCLRYASFGSNSGRWVLGGAKGYNKAI